MMNFLASFFDPLPKEYCVYFYYLAVITFVIFIMAVVGVVKKIMKFGFKTKPEAILVLITPFIMYFQNRLLYSMCMN